MVLEPAVPPLMISIRPPFEIVAPDRLPPDHTTSMPPEDTLVPAAEPNTCSTPPRTSLAVALPELYCTPPDSTVALLAAPSDIRYCTPPLDTVVETALPPPA